MLQDRFKPGGLVSAFVTYRPGPSIRFSSYFPYQAGFGVGHFHKTSYQSGPNIGSKTDFWLVWGRYVFGIETCIKRVPGWYYCFYQVSTGIRVVLPQLIPDW
jgi:hypothetical protein